MPAHELDPWLQYVGWEMALSQSKHNIIKTAEFAREPDADETELNRLLRAWNHILERCLDTLAAID